MTQHAKNYAQEITSCNKGTPYMPYDAVYGVYGFSCFALPDDAVYAVRVYRTRTDTAREQAGGISTRKKQRVGGAV